MKLNPDCVRDILLTVEEYSGFYRAVEYIYGDPRFNRLNTYIQDEVAYHIQQCEKANLIHGVAFYDMGRKADILDLTPEGHQFLANIRESKIWNGVKEIAGKIGTTSLDAITQIASNVITELIKAQFGLI